MQFRGALLVMAMTVGPIAAQAQPIQGLYVGAGAGLHMQQNTTISTINGALGGGQPRLSQDTGFVVLGNIGYALGNGARFEIEGDFNRASLNQLRQVSFPNTASGTMQHYGVMANALFDMDIGVPWLYPYVGVGAGYQWTSLNNASINQTGGPNTFRANASTGAFAVQGIAGTSFPIPNMPGLSITSDYRLMDILGGGKISGTAGGAPTQIKLHNQFDHNFIIGVRYAFNTAPPAMASAASPSAVPAAEAARSYLVFFDWDKANLTDRARTIVKDAATNATKAQNTRIDVTGNADTSGTHTYNQALSMRRAEAVAAELVKNGVAKTAIMVTAAGDTKPLVPTGPGVREPQNRRVEIVLH